VAGNDVISVGVGSSVGDVDGVSVGVIDGAEVGESVGDIDTEGATVG
jgi:hypothetical protein